MKEIVLDNIISLLKEKFHKFSFINTLKENYNDISLDDNYAIIVKNISENEILKLYSYANENIFKEMIENG